MLRSVHFTYMLLFIFQRGPEVRLRLALRRRPRQGTQHSRVHHNLVLLRDCWTEMLNAKHGALDFSGYCTHKLWGCSCKSLQAARLPEAVSVGAPACRDVRDRRFLLPARITRRLFQISQLECQALATSRVSSRQARPVDKAAVGHATDDSLQYAPLATPAIGACWSSRSLRPHSRSRTRSNNGSNGSYFYNLRHCVASQRRCTSSKL